MMKPHSYLIIQTKEYTPCERK